MLIKTVIAGFGGQGVLFMGYCLTAAAMNENYHTTYLPAYGPEVRGGTANCTVAISDDVIASPVASEPDYVVVMNNPSLLRFQAQVDSGGVLFVNKDLVDIEPYRGDISIVKVPAVSLAQSIGNPRGMNVVMLGAVLQRTRLLDIESMEIVIRKMSLEKSEKLVAPNLEALRAGYEWSDA
jgi:2-oxoglutarate ferredoxin oxidoreductase subunit gamma